MDHKARQIKNPHTVALAVTRATQTVATADQRALSLARELDWIVQPAQTILFGSRARGDYRLDSDVDVLIIKETPPPDDWLEEIRDQARTLQKAEMPEASGIDVICMTPKEFNSRRHLRNNLANSIAKQGVNIVAGENLGYGTHSEEAIDWEEVDGKIKDATGAANMLEAIAESGILAGADDKQIGRMAQNALENAYKAALGAYGLDCPTSGRDGHNLRVLTGLVRENPGIPDTEPVPGEDHCYLTEFGGAAPYAHEHPPLDKERIAQDVPAAVAELRALVEQAER